LWLSIPPNTRRPCEGQSSKKPAREERTREGERERERGGEGEGEGEKEKEKEGSPSANMCLIGQPSFPAVTLEYLTLLHHMKNRSTLLNNDNDNDNETRQQASGGIPSLKTQQLRYNAIPASVHVLLISPLEVAEFEMWQMFTKYLELVVVGSLTIYICIYYAFFFHVFLCSHVRNCTHIHNT